MRTTVTLEPDTEALIRKAMRERGIGFKEVLNEAVRAGLAPGRRPKRFSTETANLGMPAVNLDRALQLAAQLEDDELTRKMQLNK